MFFPNSDMVGSRAELDAVNRRLFLESFYHFIHPVIYDIYSPLLTTWDDIVGFAGEGIDVVLMNRFDFVLKRSYSEVPYPNLFVLPCTETDFVVFEGDVFDSIVSFQDQEGFDDIILSGWTYLSFGGWRALNIKEFKFVSRSTD